MTEIVLLQCPIDHIDRVDVLVGAANIEAATGLTPTQSARLYFDDKKAIWDAINAGA